MVHDVTPSVHRTPSVMEGVVDGQAVLFNLGDRQLHQLNDSGATCWKLLERNHSVASLIDAVAEAYDLTAHDVGNDVETLVQSFLAGGLCSSEPPRAKSSNHPLPEVINLDPGISARTIGPFSVFGVPVFVESHDALLFGDLSAILSPLIENTDANTYSSGIAVSISVSRRGEFWSVSTNGAPGRNFASRESVKRHVVATINSEPLGYVTDMVAFHAAAVEFESGVVLFPGVSNAGKSTLVTQLVHRGYRYLTDEAAAVRVGTREAAPFPKSITLEPASQRALSGTINRTASGTSIDIDPRTVGPGILSCGGPITGLVFPEYVEDAKTNVRSLEPFEVFSQLLANAFLFDHVGQCAFDTIVSLANEMAGFALVHSGEESHLDEIESLFAHSEAVLG